MWRAAALQGKAVADSAPLLGAAHARLSIFSTEHAASCGCLRRAPFALGRRRRHQCLVEARRGLSELLSVQGKQGCAPPLTCIWAPSCYEVQCLIKQLGRLVHFMYLAVQAP